jgi:hypothetical protein
MKRLAIHRLKHKWNETIGWGKMIPPKVYFRGGRLVTKWAFNGASLDQGLLFHYYVLGTGNVTLIDIKFAKRFSKDFQSFEMSFSSLCDCCQLKIPMQIFAHFTGNKKPWLQDLNHMKNSPKKIDSYYRLWAEYLDGLNLPVNSTNIQQLAFKPPLGYFYPNK